MQNVQPIVKPDPEQMRKQLEHMFGGDLDGCHEGLVELAWTNDAGELKLGDHFGTDQLEDFVERAVALNSADGVNVFVGAALRKPDTPPMGRSNDSDFFALPCVYVDVDDDVVALARETYRHRGCPPTGVTVTGRTPHVRAQMYWRLDEPIRDPSQSRAVNRALADALGGDITVVNPGRVLRLAGSVAWPKKPGRVREQTEWHGFDAERPRVYMMGQIIKAFPALQDAPEASPGSDAPRKPISGRIDIQRALDATREPGHWHRNMVAAVASMVSSGWHDEQIRLACAPYCDKGADDPDLDPIIGTARRKWNRPDEAPQAEPDDDNSGPFPASDLRGTAPPRQWLVEDWIPQGYVSSLYGDGGAGKTLLAQQLAYSMAVGMPWLGLQTRPGKSLCVFCEDERDELHMRHDAIKTSLGYAVGNPFADVQLWPRVGHNNLLVTFDTSGRPTETPFFLRVLDEVERLNVDLLILDTAADLFGGNEIVRAQVNYFIKSVCGKAIRLAKERFQNLTVLLLAHPSASGMASGSGTGGSTGWNAAVRSRLYLTRPENGLDEERVLTRMKANYASSGEETGVHLVFGDGVLAPTGRADGDTVWRIELANMQKQIKEMVAQAWDEGRPYKSVKTSERYLHRAMVRELAKDNKESRQMVIEALRRLVSDEDLITTRTNKMRGWNVAGNG